jgi:hypothetical protein
VQILANALPGFRDLRAPIIAGYMWLFFAWLIVQPDVHHRPAGGVGAAAYDLANDMGRVGLVVAVSVAAYLVGAVSESASEGLVWLWRHFATLRASQREIGRVLPPDDTPLPRVVLPKGDTALPPVDPMKPGIDPALQQIASLFERARGVLEDGGPLPREYAPPDEALERLLARAHEAAADGQRELELPATLLVADQPMLFAEVDRLRAEGDLRITVSLPLLALSTVLAATTSSGWWAFGAVGAAVLFLLGVRRIGQSRRVIADAMQMGLVKSPSLQRYRGEIEQVIAEITDYRKASAASRLGV